MQYSQFYQNLNGGSTPPEQQKVQKTCNNSCDRCGNQNLKFGAGRKPGEESVHCSDCRKFLGYSPVKRLKRLRKQGNLSDSIDFLESCGVVSRAAQIFVLSEIGAIGGES